MQEVKKNTKQDLKNLILRVPKNMWLFLKHTSADEQTSINSIVIEQIEKYRHSYEKKKLNQKDSLI